MKAIFYFARYYHCSGESLFGAIKKAVLKECRNKFNQIRGILWATK